MKEVPILMNARSIRDLLDGSKTQTRRVAKKLAMPPMLDGEMLDKYTNRLLGTDGTNRRPYKERRNRQCSIGNIVQVSIVLGRKRGSPTPCLPIVFHFHGGAIDKGITAQSLISLMDDVATITDLDFLVGVRDRVFAPINPGRIKGNIA